LTARYFEDFTVGERFRSRGVTLTESQILEFALLYDPQPFHLDREAAAASHFGGLIASGFQTLVLSFRMICQEQVFNACSVGSPGMDELRWLHPVRPGDTLTCEIEITELRRSRSRPDRGLAKLAYTTFNQDGTAVMRFTATQIFLCRPAAEGPAAVS